MKKRKRRLRKLQKLLRKVKEKPLRVEPLEDRRLLATWNIANFADDPTDATVDTLREAIIAHNDPNNMDPIDTINLSAGHYNLTLTGGNDNNANTGDLDVTKRFSKLIIEGGTTNAADTVIDANQIDRVFDLQQNADVVFRNLTITGGSSKSGFEDHGGGIRNRNAQMELDNVVLTGNRTEGSGNDGRVGAGFYMEGQQSFAKLTDVVIDNNTTFGAGAGFYNRFGVIDAHNLTVTNNTVLSSAQEGGGFWVGDQSQLNVTGDLVVEGNSSTSHGGGFRAARGAVVDASAADSVSVSGNQINDTTNDRRGGGFYSGENAVVKLNNATIDNNNLTTDQGRYGGGFANQNHAKVYMTGGSISGNKIQDGGGGFWNSEDGFVSLTDVDITGNDVRDSHGGGFWNRINGTVELTNVNIQNNEAEQVGGGFFNEHAGSSVTLNGGDISGNKARTQRGGGFFNRGTVLITNADVTNNAAGSSLAPGNHDQGGGGFWQDSGRSNTTIIGGSITDNTAFGRGAGFFTDNGTVNISDNSLEISRNKVLSDQRGGGGFWSSSSGRVTLTSTGKLGHIDDNVSTEHGGGFYSTGRDGVTITNMTIDDNTTKFSGGGFFVADRAGTHNLIDVPSISGNTAEFEHGGGFRIDGGTLNITGGTNIDNNFAGFAEQTGNQQDVGGGFAVFRGHATEVNIEDATIRGNKAVGEGAGIYNDGGQINLTLANNKSTPITGNEQVTDGSLDRYGGGISNHNEAQVFIEGGIIEDNKSTSHGGGIWNSENSELKITNGSISNNEVLRPDRGGGGIWNRTGGEVYLTNVDIKDNIAGTSGGGVLNEHADSVFILNGGEISGNQAATGGAGNGGGVYNAGTLELTNVPITDNHVLGSGNDDRRGGGIYSVGRTNNVMLDNSPITFNTSYGPGGGAWFSSGTAVLKNGTVINDNTVLSSSRRAGGLWVSDTEEITITDGEIARNTATEHGGGVMQQSRSKLTLIRTPVHDNVTRLEGGGIWVENIESTTTLIDSPVTNNTAENSHGGGLRTAGTATIIRSDISNNIAGSLLSGASNAVGGGIYAPGWGADITLVDSNVENNTAAGRGAGFYIDNGLLGMRTDQLSSVEISGNTGTSDSDDRGGGGFWASGDAEVTLENVNVRNNVTPGHGGGWDGRNDATISITNGVVSGNQVTRDGMNGGGGHISDDVHLTLTNVDVMNNITGNQGGGLALHSTRNVVSITNSEISGNIARRSHGGGISNRGTLTLDNVVITNNKNNDDGAGTEEFNNGTILVGGGIYNEGFPAVITATDVQITDNKTHGRGGGFYNNNGVFNGTNINISGNENFKLSASNQNEHRGGGFWSSGGAIVSIDNTKAPAGWGITGNIAYSHGGGFASHGSSIITLTNVDIDDNSARFQGGGFYSENAETKITITGGKITNNVSTESVGGGFSNRSQLTITGTPIENNATTLSAPGANDDRFGGGFYNDGAGTVTITDGTINNNEAAGRGGGFLNAGNATVNLVNTPIQNNTVISDRRTGGGFWNSANGIVNIQGDGTAATAISGNTATEHGGGIHNRDNGVVNLDGVWVTGNFAIHPATNADGNNIGGGVYQEGTDTLLTLTNSKVDNNISEGRGAGIYNSNGEVIAVDSSISGNTMQSPTAAGTNITLEGGGFWNSGLGRMELTRVHVDNNYAQGTGGGFYNVSDTSFVYLTDSTVNGNTAANNHGGGFRNNGTVIGTRVQINDNKTLDAGGGTADRVGGGFFNTGTRSVVKLTDAEVSGNFADQRGGGIFNNGTGRVELNRVTVADNIAGERGGGIYQESGNSEFIITNSTISNNRAGRNADGTVKNATTGHGGGIYNVSNPTTMTVIHSTIADNDATGNGGGIERADGTVLLHNTIVVDNVHDSDLTVQPNDVDGTINGTGTNVVIFGTVTGGTTINADPNLQALAANGGFGRTHAILPGSSAEDVAAASSVVEDQRTMARPQGAGPDVGAYEIFSPTGAVPTVVTFVVPDSGTQGSSVGLNATASGGDGGLTYRWYVTDPNGTVATLSGASTSFTPALGGEFKVGLAVQDADGDADSEAATITVAGLPTVTISPGGDGIGAGTLRGEIIAAHASSNVADVIALNPGTYTLSLGGADNGNTPDTGDLDISKTTGSITIVGLGAGPGDTVIDAGGIDRVLQIHPGATLVLQNLTITGGVTAEHGGGFRNDRGVITLEDVRIVDNMTTSGDARGGGFWNVNPGAEVTMTNTLIDGNSVFGRGGGFANDAGANVTIIDSQITNNSITHSDREGGGFWNNDRGVITLLGDVVIDGNTSTSYGGGFENIGRGVVDGSGLNSISIQNNVVTRTDRDGAGFLNGELGKVVLVNATINSNGQGDGGSPNRPTAGRRGGGFVNQQQATVEITGGSIDGNRTLEHGGGFWNADHGEVTLNGVTVNDNIADNQGGAFFNGAPGVVTIIDGQINNNRSQVDVGGGFSNRGEVNLVRTPISGNTTEGTGNEDRRGGGFFNSGATAVVTITDGEITGNTAHGRGAGFFNEQNGQVIFKLDQNSGVLITNNQVLSTDQVGGGFWNGNGGEVTVPNPTITTNTATSHGGGFYQDARGVVNLIGATDWAFSANKAGYKGASLQNSGRHGGAFWSRENSTVNLVNANITSNVASGGAGGFFLEHSTTTVNMDGGIIAGNIAETSHGGGFWSRGQVTLTGVDITNNEVQGSGNDDRRGGGFYNEGGQSNVIITDGNITGNSAYGHAGGFWNNGGNIEVINTNPGTPLQISGNMVKSSSRRAGAFWNNESGTVTISDAVIENNVATEYAGGFYISDRAKVVLNNTPLINNTAGQGGGGFMSENPATDVTINGGAITGNVAERNHGGGIWNRGRLSITGADIANNISGSLLTGNPNAVGGGLFNQFQGIVTLTDVNIVDNDAWGRGGGLYNEGIVTMKADQAAQLDISRNEILASDREGGGIFNTSSGEIYLTNVNVDDNIATSHGGGINQESGLIEMTNGSISRNKSTRTDRDGGGFRQNGTGRVYLTNVKIEENTTGREGGGFRSESRENIVVFNGGTIYKNSAGTVGGGFRNRGTAILTDVPITFNTAQNEGGGIWTDGLDGASVTFNNSDVNHNTAVTGVAGGIRVSGSNVFLNGSDVSFNESTANRGGGFWINGRSQVEMTDGNVEGNIAGNREGGFHIRDQSTFIMNGVNVINNTAATGGGGWFAESNDTYVSITDGKISGNTAGSEHGGGFWSRGRTDLTRVDITNNQVLQSGGNDDRRGGGFYLDSVTAIVNIVDGSITDNKAGRGAGFDNVSGVVSITTDKSASVEIARNEIIASDRQGGGFFVDGVGEVMLENVDITDNISTHDGGGFYATSNSQVTMTDGKIFQNKSTQTADRRGGGFRMAGNAIATLTNVFVDENEASRGGGGWVEGSGTRLVFNGGSISNNTARTIDSGGLWVSGTADISNVNIDDNTAQTEGGGLFVVDSGARVRLTDVTIDNNTANTNRGGGIRNSDGAIYGTNVSISGNTALATDGGGGIWSNGGSAYMELTNATIDNNTATGPGGGITLRDDSRLIIHVGSVSGNTSTTSHGGGIWAVTRAYTQLTDVHVDNNTALLSGGGVHNRDESRFEMTGGSISNNSAGEYGGGARFHGGNARAHLMGVVVDGNVTNQDPNNLGTALHGANYHGGGIYVEGSWLDANMTVISNNKILGVDGDNHVGGGIWNNNSTTFLTDSTVDGNYAPGRGGGFFNNSGNGQLVFDGVTVSNNNASERGGGIYTEGGADIYATNSTISGNKAGFNPFTSAVSFGREGGGVYTDGNGGNFVSLNHVTVANNNATSGGGGVRHVGGTLKVENTLIGDNTALSPNADLFGAVSSSMGVNLVENPTGATGLSGSDITGQDPMLGPLAFNGGKTQTHALLEGSPAIDAAIFNAVIPITEDQRDIVRVIDPDIGAFEVSVTINEVDADTPGADAAEFVELFSIPNKSLDGYVLVFYNGNGDVSYRAFDLDGYSTDANGFFTVGNAAVPGVDITFANGTLQNGPDAVALYAGDASSFPNGTPVLVDNTLIDAYVYGNGASGTLLSLLRPDEITTVTLAAAADAFVRSNTATTNYGLDPELRVKNQGTGFTRKSYVRFDLSSAPSNISDAELQLTVPTPVPNVGGSSGLNWTFNVYGLDDGDPGESWVETTINWNNAPANDTGSGSGVLANASLLGTFNLTGRGTAGQVVGISGAALANFLNSDTDGLATFIVTRVQPETGSDTVVHIFSSKEGSAGPELVLHAFAPGAEIADTEFESMQRVPNGTGPQRATSNLELLYPTPAGPGLNPDRTGINSVLSIAAGSAVHQEGSGNTYTFIVTRTGDVVGSSTVEYAVSGGAVNPANAADFGGTLPSGSIVFGPLETQKTISITTVSDDNTVEADETFDITLTRADRGETFDANAYTASGTIENDDTASVTLTPLNANQDEGTGGTTTAFTFEATLDNPVDGGFSLAYTTNDGTGATAATTADLDYQDNDSSLSFSGTMNEMKTITVLVNHDNKVEADELFNVLLGALTPNLSGVDAADITVDNVAEDGTIVNDDMSMLTITGVTKAEGNSGQTDFDFVVTLSNPVQGGVWVQADTGDGQDVDAGLNATTADNDYDQKTETLMFAGMASEQKTFTVKVNGDTAFERDEIFEAILSMVAAQGAGVDSADITIVGSPATGTILNDDTDIIIIGTGDDDTLEIIATGPDSGTYQLTTLPAPGAGPVIPFAGVTSVTFISGAGNDELRIINQAGGLFAPAGVITFDAGDDNDVITLTGGDADTETYWVGTTDPGSDPDRGAVGEGTILTTDNSGPTNQRIKFTGLEAQGPGGDASISDTTTVTSLTIFGTNVTNGIAVNNGAGAGNEVSIDSFAAIDFENKVNVVINANADDGGGNDAGDFINLNSTVAATGLASVTINSDSGDVDLIFINASTPTATDVNGGTGGDIFIYAAGAFVLDGTIDGGAGSDAIFFDLYTTARTLSLTGIGSLDGYAGRDVSGTPALTGGFDNIDFLFGTVQSDTLNGADLDTTWKIKDLADVGSPDDEGDVFDDASMQKLTYGSFESLGGGSGSDKFTFEDQRTVSGTLGGGGGEDTLDFSDFTTPINVDLSANTANQVTGGLLAGTTGSSIENVLGGSAGDTITGDDDDNKLGDGGGSDTLDGGMGNDTFLLQPGDGENDVLTDISGNDTVSFGGHNFGGPAGMQVVYAPAGNGIMIDMDLTDTPMDVSMAGSGQNLQLNSNGSGLPSPFENVVGSPLNDMFWIRPQSESGDLPTPGTGSIEPITKLLASDGATGDRFGYRVSIDGDTAVVGVTDDDDNGMESGSVYIFRRSGTTWIEEAKLIASDGMAADRFGLSVAIDGETVVVGANGDDDNGSFSGSAYVFTRSGTTWTEQAKLTASDGATNDQFGVSVAVDNDTIVVGATRDDDSGIDSGSAYVFKRTGTTWTEEAKLLASDGAPDDQFGGFAVAVERDTAVVGAHFDDDAGNDSGSAYVFRRSGSTWAQEAKLVASDGAAGHRFGFSLALDGDMILVGAHGDDDNGSSSGSAYIFERVGTTWSEEAKLSASDGAADDFFGLSVAIQGNGAVIGAPGDDDAGSDSGSTYVFARQGSTWTEMEKLTAADGNSGDRFGHAVAIDDGVIAAAADFDDDNGNNSGSVYLFAIPMQASPPVARNVDGNPPVIGDVGVPPGDILIFNANGQAVVDTGLSLTASGVGTVNYQSIETVNAYNQGARIVDNGDPGFANVPTTAQSPTGWREIQRAASANTAAGLLARSFDHDLLVSPKGSGSNKATWTFGGLTPGMDYSIAMAWPQDDSLATNAPVRVLDGGTQLAVLALDQNSGPNDFQAEGVLWENLGVFRSDSGELVVELSNAANGQVFADAVRLEKYTPGPELRVLVDGNVEVDDPSGELQFSAATGGQSSKTIAIANVGNANLLIYGIQLADGSSYSLSGAVASASPGSPTTIAPGLSTTFTVTLNGVTAGDKVDAVRIFSNDVDENVPLKQGATGIANPTNPAQDVDPFTFALDGSVFSSKIIDDEDPGYSSGGFTEFGIDVGNPPQGYHGDLEFSKVGSGADKAYWQFTGLVAGGTYKVSVTWTVHSNRATDAPYTVLDGSRLAGSPFAGGEISVNQQLSPAVATGSTTFDVGLDFADLGTFTVTGSTLTVGLTDLAPNSAGKFVIADAARVELVGNDPDVRVEADAVEVDDDTGEVNFGTIFSNETDPALTTKTITITNTSTTTALTLGKDLTLPAGFSVVPGSQSVATLFDGMNTTPLAAGANVTFDLRVSGSAEGTLGGDVSFAVNGDVDENPFDFRVTAEISNRRIIDNGTPATVPADLTHPADTYSESGSWSGPNGDGYLNDDRFVAASGSSTPTATADWQFNNLPKGLYEVFVTYHEEPLQGGARRAPFAVYDGPAGATPPLQTVEVNQQVAPVGIHINGVNWKKLGGQFNVSTGTLSVRLSNPASAGGVVAADAVMLRRLDGPEVQLVDVTATATNVADGGAVDFGNGITVGSSVQRTFEIRNLGTATLALGPPAALSHFTVNGNFTSVAPGGAATFTIAVDTSVSGIFTEELRFATSDQDESIYNVKLTAGIGTFFIDDHDAAWSQTGNWVTQVNRGFDDDISSNANVGGTVETATYAFTNVPEGRYRAIATWLQQNNLATNAQYNISGNAAAAPGSSLMPVIDQKAGPNDLTLAGAQWEQLAVIDVSNGGNPGAVTVVLTSAGANNFVYADAIALVPLNGPQIVVTDLGLDEAPVGGDDVVLSGGELVNFGGQATRTIQIENVGFGPLTLGNPLLPAGFSITATDQFENTVGQNGTETFQIQYNGTTPGTFGGLVSFGTNDAEHDPFTFQVSATVAEAVQIIDNRDPGFSQIGFTEFGLFTNQNPQGYKDSLHYSKGGSGADVATWTFSGVPDGTYLVSATWTPHSNRATDAPFSIGASGGDSGQLDVNQQVAPNDFSDAGVAWENLGAIRVTGGGGLLTVTLTDDIDNDNKFVIADAIRIEPITAPEIEVTDLGADGAVGGGDDLVLHDGGTVDFGATAQNVPVDRKLQIENTGENVLDLSNLSATGANFSIAPGGNFSQTALNHGETATIIIRYSAASQGTSNGTVTFDNNDSDENPFNFSVIGRVSEGGVVVIDDGNAGWTGPGFINFTPQGFADSSDGISDVHFSQVGNNKTATWTFTNLVSGTYRVSTTYTPHSNRADASPFTVYDSNGTTVLATAAINQRVAPNDFGDGGAFWEDISGGVSISGNTLKVTLSDNAPGQSGTRFVIADAVRIEKIENAPEIELRDQTGGGANVQSGTAIDLGTIIEGAMATRDLLIKNVGSGILTVSDVSLLNTQGTAFGLTADPDPINGTGNIAAGASAGFQVSLNTSTPGTYSAKVTIASNDADEATFTVNLTATVNDVAIIDDGDAGFTAPQFTRFGPPANPAQGFQGDLHYRTAESSIFVARWEFTGLPSGNYQVATTWTQHSNRASDAPFRVYDGTVEEAQATVNQRIAPQPDKVVGTTAFEELAMVNISSGTLVVELGTTTTGFVIADAVRIEGLGSLLAASTGNMAAGTGRLSDTDVATALSAAVAAWTEVDPSAAARLASVDVRVADLPEDVLGLASEHQSRIWLDANAAGHGWDLSGVQRAESGEPGTSAMRLRSSSGPQLSALDSPLSFDLLTVVTHELGHVLGLPDVDPHEHASDIMAGRLDVGARRMPLDAVVESAIEPPIESAVAERAMAQFSDRMFMDLGHYELPTVDGATSLFDDRVERSEPTQPAWLARSAQAELAMDAVLRIDEDDAALAALRHDDEEVIIDRLFSELVEDNGEPQDEIL